MIGSTLPITSAETKRPFSLLMRIKTYTKSTMAGEHFSDPAVIAMYYSDRISMDKICYSLVQAHPRRLFKA